MLDANGELLPVGARGEIFIGGAGVGRGYVNRAGMTAERFIPDPYGREAGGRLYRTGDLGRWRGDGQLEFVGRNDDQVKLRGYRIELGEIEARLLEHRQVSQAVVMVREDTPGDKRLVAYYTVANSQPDPGAEQLRYQLSSQLPEYMVPSAYVLLEALPLTVNGKVDRKALPEPEWGSKGGGYEGPQTPVEEILGGIWCEVLKLERVGREENFFSLGGHSLLATQIMSRVREAMRVEVPLRWLFEAPVLREFAVRLESARKDKTGEGMAALVRQEGRGRLRLSFAQQRLWFLDQLEPGSSAYNVPAALRMKGELDIWALAKSFTEIVRRHEVLRTVFVVEDGEAEQRIEEPGEVAVPVVDVSGLEEEGRESKARGVVEQEAGRAFDLRRGPLLRVRLVRLGEQEHVLLVNLHHIVTDGWSTAILVREFMVLYEVYCEDKASPLGELEIQYADYAVWQREWLQGEVLEKELGYWRTQLGGVEPLEMPTDYPRTAGGSHPGDWVHFVLPEELSEGLTRLSRDEGVTLFMVLLAVWKVLLSRYSGQEDFAVGTDVANRNRLETEGLIGFFVNTLALRSPVGGERSFGEYLGEIRRVVLESYEHQDIAFERVVEEVAVVRDLERNPLVQTVLTLQNTPKKELRMEHLFVESYEARPRQAKFELSLTVNPQEQQLVSTLEYAADLYERATMERMAEHWKRLLESGVKDPRRPLYELEMLSAAERGQLLDEWNQTEREEEAWGVLDWVWEQAKQQPEAIAVSDGPRALSYEKLRKQSGRMAWELRQRGVEREVRVGVYLSRSLELVIAVLGVMESGGTYVPLDPGYPAERIRYMAEDAGVGLTVSLGKQKELALGGQELCLEEIDWEEEDKEREGWKAGPVLDQQLAYVLYTSGSTGQPKGAMIEYCGMDNHVLAKVEELGLKKGEGVGQNAPSSFDISVWQILAPLVSGGRVEVIGGEEAGDSERTLECVQRRQIAVLETVPSMLALMVEQQRERGEGKQKLSNLRWMVCNAEALAMGLCRGWGVCTRE